VFEPCQIKSCSDEILDTLSEDNMAAIVAAVKGLQNVRRIICYAVIMALHIAHPVARRRRWWWLGWILWMAGDLEKAALLDPLTIAPMLPKLERQLLVLPAQWRGLSRVGIAS
jgi:hypothetical protein